MEGIGAWAAALCAAAVGCSLLHVLAPKNGMGKIFKLLLAAFFLCCLLAPLLNLKSLTSLQLPDLGGDAAGESLQDRVNEQVERQIDAALLRVANETLKNYGTKVEKVKAMTDTSEDGGICITQVVLYLDKQNIRNSITAKQVMEKRLEVEVIVQDAD